MGISEGLALVFLATLPRIFLSRPAQTIETNAGLAWFAVIVSPFAILLPILLLLYVFRRVEGDLYIVTTELIGKWGAWAVSLVLIMMFLSDAALLLRQFAENTLLTALPYMDIEVAIAWYIFTAAFLCYLGIECIARTSYFLLPLGMLSLFLVLAALIPYYDLNNLGPWQGRGFSQALATGVTASGINYGVILLFILGPAFQSLRTVKWAALVGLGGSSLLKSLSIFIFTIVFGPKIALEKTLPFFEMARMIYLGRYIQRVEALFIVLWVIAGIISIAISFYMAGYLIARMLNLSTSRPFIASLGLLVAGAAMLPHDIVTVIHLDEKILATLHLAGLYGIPILLFGATIVKGRRKKPWTNV